jgi:hypothetical protein
MAGMWSKAPPKRKQPASAPAAAAVHGDADAALRAAQQVLPHLLSVCNDSTLPCTSALLRCCWGQQWPHRAGAAR